MADIEGSDNRGTMLVWPLHGAGLENLGRDGEPERWPIPRPAANELLVRVDAVGLCYSDVKIIRMGGEHPRLYGRDLGKDPIVQGHEVSLTVVEVGRDLEDRFKPGQRLAMQADIYHGGRNLAYGYMIAGGLEQYSILGPEILEGDEGCYAIPASDALGYAEIALTEPWACVEAAYAPRRRLEVKPGGVLWIVGNPGDTTPYRLGATLAGGLPGRVVLTDVPEALQRQIAETGVPTVIRDGVAPDAYAGLAERETQSGFDDLIILQPPDAGQVEKASRVAAAGATVNLVGHRPLDGPVVIDIGRVHYDYIAYLGTGGPDIGAAYGTRRNRSELRPGGVAWVVGGGGPMGRMQIQRMLEMPAGQHPRKVVVAETNPVRRADLVKTFAPMAAARGIEFTVFNPRPISKEEFNDTLAAAHGGRGFDDIVIMVASVPAVETAMPHLAADGMLVLFAGLARGTYAHLDISNVYLGDVQITGTSGSQIRDQMAVIRKAEVGELSPAHAVAAIGGMDAAHAGMQSLTDRSYPGKVVIYPQVPSFPLTALPDLAQVAPGVHALLSPTGTWTQEAEAEFLRLYAGES